ncbi:MAG: hypothetical protein E6R13_06585 [Spirochaetes bacterium]|nr:MAG: hypothetical protein E6R13_06585 [Spirochaetota bacterium]
MMYNKNDRVLVRSHFNDRLYYDTKIIDIVEDKYVVNETCMDSERLVTISDKEILGIFNGCGIVK